MRFCPPVVRYSDWRNNYMNSNLNKNKNTSRNQSTSEHPLSETQFNTNPLVSVVIPTFNRAHLVVDTLASILRQNYRPLEVILVDDGSTDDSLTVVRRWNESAKSDTMIQCHVLEQANRGAAAARNLGMGHATGKYIHFLDSDDVLGDFFYATLVQAMEARSDCSFAWGEWIVAEDAREAAANLPRPTCARSTARRALPPNNAWCGIYRSQSLPSTLAWDESLPNHNDWNFTTRFLLSRPSELLCVPEPLMVYRTHVGSERLARIQTVPSLRAAIESADRCAAMLDRRHPWYNELKVRISSEYITLFLAVLECNYPQLKWLAARKVVRHFTVHQSAFLNGIALALLGLLPVAGSTLGKRGLHFIRRHIG
jgi:glycosyltransferase involved in cell wall biosynthesis